MLASRLDGGDGPMCYLCNSGHLRLNYQEGDG